MKKLLYFILIISLNSFSQTVKIDTLHFYKSEQNTSPLDKLIYPIFKTGNKKIDSLINFDLKNKYTYNEAPNLSINKTLKQWIGDQIGYINFNITYNRNNIISFNIETEGCAAYCTYWKSYFNYNTKTGKSIKIDSLLKLNNFKQQILDKKNEQFENEIKQLKELFKQKDIDKNEYDWVYEYLNKCKNDEELEDFSLNENHIEFIETCSLPNAIKNMTPAIDLKYKYNDIREYLNFELSTKIENYYNHTNHLEIVNIDNESIKIDLMISNEKCAMPNYKGILSKSTENCFEGFVYSDKGEIFESKHHLKIIKSNKTIQVSSNDSYEKWQLGAFCRIEGKYKKN
jgi:hypothetical protein